MTSHIVIGFIALTMAIPNVTYSATPQFIGHVAVQWSDDEEGPDRSMVLLDKFGFRDSSGLEWWAPKGAKIDGASIPRVFWTAVGSPFTGDYRRASVVHDRYCDTKERPWQTVHRMFYEAMIAGGVSQVQAKVLYAAVYGGGPRWTKVAGAEPGQFTIQTFTPNLTDDDFQKLSAWIESDNPDLITLESRVQQAVTK